MLFLTGWLTFVYFPFVHMVWGGGFLQQWGVKDFAGGIVVHNIAGIAALASVIYVGKRRIQDRGPHSIPLVALGTGLLWFGWYGFNAGSEMRVDSVTATAFLNTDLAASFAAIAWLLKQPHSPAQRDWRDHRASPNLAKRLDCARFTAAFPGRFKSRPPLSHGQF